MKKNRQTNDFLILNTQNKLVSIFTSMGYTIKYDVSIAMDINHNLFVDRVRYYIYNKNRRICSISEGYKKLSNIKFDISKSSKEAIFINKIVKEYFSYYFNNRCNVRMFMNDLDIYNFLEINNLIEYRKFKLIYYFKANNLSDYILCTSIALADQKLDYKKHFIKINTSDYSMKVKEDILSKYNFTDIELTQLIKLMIKFN